MSILIKAIQSYKVLKLAIIEKIVKILQLTVWTRLYIVKSYLSEGPGLIPRRGGLYKLVFLHAIGLQNT